MRIISSELRINKNHVIERFGEEMTIFEIQKSKIHRLNESASYIFESIEKGRNEQDIVRLFKSRYQISVEEARKDVGLALGQMLRKGIISCS